jgi:pilus assembly protein Flp/PilA
MNLINDQSGVTAIEYALIAALIAVAAIAAFTLVGTNLSNTFRLRREPTIGSCRAASRPSEAASDRENPTPRAVTQA